jgi:hypothetical protein
VEISSCRCPSNGHTSQETLWHSDELHPSLEDVASATLTAVLNPAFVATTKGLTSVTDVEAMAWVATMVSRVKELTAEGAAEEDHVWFRRSRRP